MTSTIIRNVTTGMRIIAVPLSRNPDLAYYHFHLASVASKPKAGGLVKWTTTKAASLWAGLGKGEEGSWQLRTYRYGESLVDRIDFEELALKTVDPSLGPTLSPPDSGGHGHKTLGATDEKIPFIYPKTIIPFSSSPAPTTSQSIHPALTHLSSLLANRTPRHRKGFYTWMIIAPFTTPFMLIPVIPNLPFFFCAWRSWSHYRAYRASQYLESLLSHEFLEPSPSTELDEVYASAPASSAEPQMLLTRDAIPRITALFELPPSAGAELHRAMEQVRMRVGRG